MPTLADYFLPPKSVLTDTPISGDIRFYTPLEAQLVGTLLMLNERRAAVGLSQYRLLKVVSNHGASPDFAFSADAPTTFDAGAPFWCLTDSTTITATPGSGYSFVGWTGDATQAGAALTIPATYNAVISLVATFKPTGDPDPTAVTMTKVMMAAGGLGYGNILARFQTILADVVSHYVNTTVHASGSLQNVTTATVWTVAAALAVAGLPGAGASGDVVLRNHLQSILAVLDLCTIPLIDTATVTGREDRDSGILSSGVSCADAKSQADTAWNAASWVAGGTIGLYDYTDDSFAAQEVASRGKITCDLTSFPSGTVKVWIKLEKQGGTTTFGKPRPTTADVNKYGEWTGHGMTVGGVRTTGYLDNTNALPGFATSCPVGGESTSWALANTTIFLTLTGISWTYHL